MNYKLHMRIPAAIFLLVVSTAAATAQPAMGGAPAIDPSTGLPITQTAPTWKDPDWKDPVKVLPEVTFDGLPVSEVARHLLDQFSNEFDIVIPRGYAPRNSATVNNQPEEINPGVQFVTLQLRNVTASEIFNAMNLEWENENTPVRWQLVMNGSRPTAVLRVVPELLTHGLPPPPAPEIKRMVFFVGNLLGSEKSGGMTLDQVVQTVETTYATVLNSKPDIHVSKDAQLLIISGTLDQVDFVKQILQALKEKVDSANLPNDLSQQIQKLKALNQLDKPNLGTSTGPK